MVGVEALEDALASAKAQAESRAARLEREIAALESGEDPAGPAAG